MNERQSLLEAATVLVGPLVGQRREKLTDQITRGAEQFHRIESGTPAPQRGVGEVVDHPLDLFGGEFARNQLGVLRIDRRRRHGMHSRDACP